MSFIRFWLMQSAKKVMMLTNLILMKIFTLRKTCFVRFLFIFGKAICIALNVICEYTIPYVPQNMGKRM